MPIYLDHAATTPVCPEAIEAACFAMREGYGNPSSGHPLGRAAAEALASARARIAAGLGCAPEELLFTSGGSESNNWAIRAALWHNRRVGKHIITSAVEHASVLEPLRALEQDGYRVSYLQPDREGRIGLSQLEEALCEETALVSLMLVNNESGRCFPVEEAARLLQGRGHRALLHTDAVQAFGKLPLHVQTLGADFASVSAHKLGGMKGSGALYVRAGLSPQPLIRGGGQERGLRAGTEATAQIAAFAAAVHVASESLAARSAQMTELKAYAIEALTRRVPKLVLVSEGDAPHICAISLPGYPSEVSLRDLGDRGIYVSAGSACHRGKQSHVFAGIKPAVAKGVLRLSFSCSNTRAELDLLCEALAEIVRTRIPARL